VSPERDHVGGAREVTEVSVPGAPPRVEHPEWARRMPWLAQGVTTRADDGTAFDMGFFGATAVGETVARWAALRAATHCPRAVHSRQVHGARVAPHDRRGPGLFLGEGADAHVTSTPGLLLTVSVADCVPAFLVDVERRALGLVHAGWRGAAAGVLEAGIEALVDAGSPPGDLLLHLGPAICGACYEVGPEVFQALGQAVPRGPTAIDLRDVLRGRAIAAGLQGANVTMSAHCTRCERAGGRRFHSHRAGEAERQIAFLGIRV
jgi:YfiH family protein